jgi:cytochrome c peroxidase
MHSACDFDTPTLRGIFATAPYFHDGSAATLRDVVDRLPFTQQLGDADRDALVAYVKTL